MRPRRTPKRIEALRRALAGLGDNDSATDAWIESDSEERSEEELREAIRSYFVAGGLVREATDCLSWALHGGNPPEGRTKAVSSRTIRELTNAIAILDAHMDRKRKEIETIEARLNEGRNNYVIEPEVVWE
jgi:hypothetical protein